MEHFQTTEASLGTAIVIQFNEYTGTREEYWAESFVKVILNAVQKQELTMKEAAGLLGVSYSILYQKYRDAFGKIGHKSVKQTSPVNMQSSGLVGSKDKLAVELAEYILDCYKTSRFCDLILKASGREAIPCHKLVLCSLSMRLRSLCLAEEEAGDMTYIHLPEFRHKEVRDIVNKIYENIGRSNVEMGTSEIITALGIECSPIKDGTETPSSLLNTTLVKVETKYSDEEPEDTSVIDDFSYSEVGEPFEASLVKNEEVDENLGEDAFHENRHSKRRRHVVTSQYKDDSDDNADEYFALSSSDDVKRERPRKRRRGNLGQTNKKKRKIECESDDDDDYIPTDAEQDVVKQDDSPAEEEYIYSDEDLTVENKSQQSGEIFSGGEKREKRGRGRDITKRKCTKRRPEVPTGEELLSKETDPEVVELQKQFSARDGNWWEPPKPSTAETTQTALRDVISMCQPSRFRVKKAGKFFNIAPAQVRHFQWNGMNLNGKKPVFAAILGVARSNSDGIDPRLVKFNGDLLVGRPLAWSFPRGGEELDAQYDAVMEAYREVLGFSEEELHCNKMFYQAQFGSVEKCNKYLKLESVPKAFRNPKGQVVTKLSSRFKTMDTEAMQSELDRLKEAEHQADQRRDPKPELKLEYDRLRLEFDCGIETSSFEGLAVVAWHADGRAVGKALNFDENTAIFMGLLRDVWLNGSIGSRTTLPFTDHIFSRFVSAYERALAPRLLQRMIDGTCPSRICPHCGKSFSILTEREQELYRVHIDNHKLDTLKCGCEDVDKIETLVDKQKHVKLHHSEGRFVRCTVPKCNEVIMKKSLEEHLKNMHVDVFCELCGKAFSNKKTYQSHYTNRHYRTTCKVCKVELFQYQMKSHMITHRGDPVPCPECGSMFADERNIKRHMRVVHTPKDKLPFRCPYPDCENAFAYAHSLLQHLNNMHFKAYLYLCEHGCPLGRYKDMSNLRAHYRKQHGQKINNYAKSLQDYLDSMTEEERVFHESILTTSDHVGKLFEINSQTHPQSHSKILNSKKLEIKEDVAMGEWRNSRIK